MRASTPTSDASAGALPSVASMLVAGIEYEWQAAVTASKRPAFIGIVIAITANVIISLALNVQKMAHIRLAQEHHRTMLQQHQDGEEEQDGEYDEDDEEEEEVDVDDQNQRQLAVRAATAGPSPPPSPSPPPRQALTNLPGEEQQSGSSTEVDSSASPPPTLGKSKLVDLEQGQVSGTASVDADKDDDDNDETRPLLSSRRHQSSSSNAGPSTQFLRSRLWWCGIGLMTLGEAGNFISYGFAPASLVAPLGAVALLSNVIIAPILLHERFRPRDLGGIALAIIGAVTVVFSSRQDDPQLGPDALWAAIRRSIFLIYMAVVLGIGAALAALSLTRLGDRFVLLDVGTCAIFGGFTVLSTKGISSMLSAGPSPFAVFRYPITYALAFVLASTAVLQITFLNRALQRFDSRQVIPTMFTLFTIMAIVGSAVLYRDFEDMGAHRLINFLFGCGTTFAGVFLLTKLHDDDGNPDQQQGADNEREGVEAAHPRREALEDVQEEEDENIDNSTAAGMTGKALVAEPDSLSTGTPTGASSSHPSKLGTATLKRAALPEHSQSSPPAIGAKASTEGGATSTGIPIASSAAGRRGRTTTVLDGAGTAFLAAGSPPGMVLALGHTGSGSPLRGNTGAGASTVTIPTTPARTGASRQPAASSAVGSGGGILPLYRNPRISLIGSGSGGGAVVGVSGPAPSASISALSAGQLLLLATPRPNAIPIAMGPSTSAHGYGPGGGGPSAGLARSLPGGYGADGRSRALSQPSTPVPRRRSRKTLRADAAAQAYQGGASGSVSGGGRTTDSRGRENYAKGQGSWTERRRPSSVLSSGTSAAGPSGGGAPMPQRRSVISLFGGLGGVGWSGGASSNAGGPEPSAAPESGPSSSKLASGSTQASASSDTPAAPTVASPPEQSQDAAAAAPALQRHDSSKTSPPSLSSPRAPLSPPRFSSVPSWAAVPVSPPPGAATASNAEQQQKQQQQRPPIAPSRSSSRISSPPIPRRTMSLHPTEDEAALTSALPAANTGHGIGTPGAPADAQTPSRREDEARN